MKNIFENKKGAMEMSVGTIVTIVLLMAVLVLGLVMVRTIFNNSTNAIENVDSEIQNQISEIFDDSDATLVVYPTSREITLNKKDDTPKGFAFAIKNDGTERETYSTLVVVQDISKCGSGFNERFAESLLLGAESGPYNLGSGQDTSSNKDLVKFVLNEDVPLCTMIYRLHVCEGYEECTEGRSTESTTIFVTIK